MRPRVFPAEDPRSKDSIPAHAGASMRPRVFPAEDVPEPLRKILYRPRFNEAAGIPRGRPIAPALERHPLGGLQ